ncbi:Charged multivesicular body protein 6 [Pseudocercospora fuligena]|uniref:Charged multivesicular body protein 6 n=1 Tax=Pseudocercospora fuligena TaxID=685502 RepID=A0A8H6R5L1_9PEZI|nr:Charged multivesicular body protein 6 [Pseudocercospora fuligena]
MGNSGSKNKVSDQDRAILDLKIQRDKLHQYQKRITTITSRETEIAKECLRSGNKQKALLALRRKKYQESLLAKTDQQLAQLQALTSDVEFALVQKDVMFGLQQGTAVLKEIHKEMGGLDKVEMILEESAEAQAYQKEINDMLAGKMSNEDEDEVEDELEAMEQEALRAQGVQNLPDAPRITTGELPDAPQESPAEKIKRRREERAARQQNEAIAA